MPRMSGNRARPEKWIRRRCRIKYRAARSRRAGARGRAPGTRKEDWIANQLRRVYDEALQEAIPAGHARRSSSALDEAEAEKRRK